MTASRAVPSLLGVVLLGDPVGLDEPGAPADLLAGPPRAVLVLDLHAGALGEPLDGVAEGQVVDLLDERDDVAALAAAEAVPDAERRPHVERRRLLVVERAEPLERPDATGSERDVLADDVLDRRTLLDRGHDLGLDPTRHHASLRSGADGRGRRPQAHRQPSARPSRQ
ncbi:hypothetical protein GCM10025868_40900 [Angustibacter aerolatus]|uniref:Secreted protein n=1 Tax=Angustibacter aerolatus TaxID=1162965 RepID=A0ABQ6JQ49_9ACTN|nr:hypothetical protein GCM10025868_40900 [Angustibacter aerolatus]